MRPRIVETSRGKLEGRQDTSVIQWRGIPYAAPPVGPLRFCPPVPPPAWAGVRDATRFGATALQPGSPMQGLLGPSAESHHEDCLSLNVYSPAADGGPYPVMVWIHGGAFVGGSGSTPWYDGSTFARAEVVVVTLNYRLGVLGFLHLAELSGEKYASSGNCGLLDQIAALTWVHDEIAAFGGDPNRVTVFGESAGGMSIGTLLAMPSAKGLFQQAILQSGSTSAFRSSEQAARTTSAVLTHLDVGVDQLVELPGERLVDAQIAVSGGSDTGGFLAFQPVVDGTSLFEPPAAAVAASSAAGIRILIGSNKNEMTLFLTFDPALADFDEIRLARRGAALVGEQAFTRMAAGYTRSRPDATPAALLEAVMTDQVFRMPAIRLAEAQISCDTPAWMYRFDWPTPVFGGVLGATHALELPFVWDVLDRRGVEVLTGDGPGRQELADRMHAAWLAFARTGQPTTTLLPDWPAYDTTRRATMLFDETCHVVDDPAAAERLLWEGIL